MPATLKFDHPSQFDRTSQFDHKPCLPASLTMHTSQFDNASHFKFDHTSHFDKSLSPTHLTSPFEHVLVCAFAPAPLCMRAALVWRCIISVRTLPLFTSHRSHAPCAQRRSGCTCPQRASSAALTGRRRMRAGPPRAASGYVTSEQRLKMRCRPPAEYKARV